MNAPGRLDGKAVIITGAASGQGRAAAQLFASEGALVMAADIDGAGLAETAATAAGIVLTSETDVSSESQVRAAVGAALQAFGRIDVVYNNAALMDVRDAALTDLDEEVWTRVLNVNLKGPFLLCKHAIPRMLETGGGVVINVASVGALKAGGSTAYGSSKGGIISLTKIIAKQYAPSIRANCIVPGAIRTPMLDVIARKPRISNGRGAAALLGRPGEPDEVARMALFLASEESAYVTGSTFLIDGGLLLS
jgi:NAD(P)-dependent dehydrogenase (short-subunit alcohol dehydrogenase family)